jgi:peptide/nickel transport system permease protein
VWRYLIHRLAQAVALLFVVSTVTFVVIHQAPGMPSVLVNPDASSSAQIAQGKVALGLDAPLSVQYARWVTNAARGKFGYSYQLHQPVVQLILSRLPASLLLSGTSLALALVLAIPLGVVSAVKPYSGVDYLATLVSFIGLSIPVFWFGIMLIILFSVRWGVLPTGGMHSLGSALSFNDLLRHLVLPVTVLTTVPTAQLMRYTRSSMRTVLRQEYLQVARSKGLRDATVLRRHALKNAIIPIVTVFGLLVPTTVSGAPVTESIFAWPGMGRLAVDAAFQRDYPVVMGVTIFISAIVIGVNLLVDLAYAYLDPRIKLG